MDREPRFDSCFDFFSKLWQLGPSFSDGGLNQSFVFCCRYERVEAQARNQGLRQRAQLLVDFELLISQDEIEDETIFPEWCASSS